MKEPALQRIFYGALALLGLCALGVGLAKAGWSGVAFALFAFMTLGGAVMCIWERSVVRSAFALMATFTGVAGLFVLLEADFLAMAQILIYVGGILALLLFAVMLTPPDLNERKLSRLAAGALFVGAGALYLGLKITDTAHWFVRGAPLDGNVAASGSAERIGVGFLAAGPYQTSAGTELGYVVAFELAAIVLTVALVAAVYIARRKPSDLQPEEKAG
ncbi:MAG: NADH-quinone oxidoreductase subunit J [Planctomycetes bacterium]|nr:NADH-quinone oxidoreductase subunit J [Planctomycetota bacterium]